MSGREQAAVAKAIVRGAHVPVAPLRVVGATGFDAQRDDVEKSLR